jgi:hypothetical protein
MRHYPRNSPAAAARIVALAMIADGRLQQVEVDTLRALDAYSRLGITPDGFRAVLNDLCADLLEASLRQAASRCRLDREEIAAMLGEVDEPALRATVYDLSLNVARADRRLEDGEFALLLEAIDRWRIDQAADARVAPSMPVTAHTPGDVARAPS